jgi:cellulose synthase/poly-beta-1,6-N-acetylglucosamine synthase-like glycosyltransferase
LKNLNDENWKAIIIFDGVKNTFDIVDERITIIEIEKKGKLGKNNKAGFVRNIGFNYVNNSDWVGFVDDDDILSNDYINKLKKEIKKNKSIDVCIFRMGYSNKKILPNDYDKNIVKCRVGISFALRSYITKNILFNNNKYEDYYYLKELEYKKYKIVISPYVCYFVNSNIYKIDKKFKRIYI